MFESETKSSVNVNAAYENILKMVSHIAYVTYDRDIYFYNRYKKNITYATNNTHIRDVAVLLPYDLERTCSWLTYVTPNPSYIFLLVEIKF